MHSELLDINRKFNTSPYLYRKEKYNLYFLGNTNREFVACSKTLINIIDLLKSGQTISQVSSKLGLNQDVVIEGVSNLAKYGFLDLELSDAAIPTSQKPQMPLPSKLSLISGSKMVYDLSSDSNDLILDVPSWVAGIIYWNKTRESNPVKFSYFVDYLGSIYAADGKGIVDKSKIALKEGDTVGYLGRKSDNGVTAQALSSAEMLTGIDIVSVRKAKVLQTPTGWLRLRSEPNLSAVEVGRVNTGDEVFIIEDKGEWKKIRTADGKEGWAYSSYLSEIKN